ncbi:16S rRNA (guanine(966)-N(2))-methyltransferase RsmD [Aquimonas sp.]|jgi:16S rRNA (guanine966-N2)-methyltransferase|uniref:16S rRNA (guanine(966)-N(2))-methyltransferase RsmD n=1 Tax=Aquimonas sp. TaxID=1872588 RepID=UPI0037C03A08
MSKPKSTAARPAEGQIRIIGGRLRGSRLPVPDLPGLRPSSDRMRETLFNWLMHEVAGRHCLDLFAGSGALGFEAASRGAERVLLVEREPRVARSLAESAQRLQAAVDVHNGDAMSWLQGAPAQLFDLAFVDPPFAAGLTERVLELLPAHLAARAWVYMEAAPGPPPVVPLSWRLHRELITRHACGRLFRADADADA